MFQKPLGEEEEEEGGGWHGSLSSILGCESMAWTINQKAEESALE